MSIENVVVGAEVCSDTQFATEVLCEAAGTCSDTQYTDATTCEAASTCSISTYTTQAACEGAGTCSDTQYTTEATCEAAGTCSDTQYTTPSTCALSGSCSDGTSANQQACVANEATWTANTWTANTWTAAVWTAVTWTSTNIWGAPGTLDIYMTSQVGCSYCSDNGYANQGACEDFGNSQFGADWMFSTSLTEAQCLTTFSCTDAPQYSTQATCEAASETWELTYNGSWFNGNVGGFQFFIEGVTITNLDGSAGTASNFDIVNSNTPSDCNGDGTQVVGCNMVLSFSFSGGFIPPGTDQLLLKATFINYPGSTICLAGTEAVSTAQASWSEAIISDDSGEIVYTDWGVCYCPDNGTDVGCGCGLPAPAGCDNTCGSTLENDACGICDGPGEIYACGCAGIAVTSPPTCDCDGNLFDECGECDGPGPAVTCSDQSLACTEADCPGDVYGCTDPEATNYNPDATIDDESCEYPLTDATQANIFVSANEVTIQADGYIGGIQMTLTHGDDFSIELTDECLISDYVTDGNETRLLIIMPETSFLFTYSGYFQITEVLVANSQELIPTEIYYYNCIMGDTNCDGQLDVLDIVLVVNMILADDYDALADMNGDEVLDILDLVIMVNLVLYGHSNDLPFQEYTDFETIYGMDEFANPTGIIGGGIWGGCLGNNEILAYPNPFSGSTSILSGMWVEGILELYIVNEDYDIVATLYNGYAQPGMHNFNWNVSETTQENGYYRAISINSAGECFINLHLTTEPESGFISGEVTFIGDWPSTGSVAISLNSNWPPTGAPDMFMSIVSDDLNQDDQYSYSFDNVAFNLYEAIVVSWQDPNDGNPATNQHIVGSYPYSVIVDTNNYILIDLNITADFNLLPDQD